MGNSTSTQNNQINKVHHYGTTETASFLSHRFDDFIINTKIDHKKKKPKHSNEDGPTYQRIKD